MNLFKSFLLVRAKKRYCGLLCVITVILNDSFTIKGGKRDHFTPCCIGRYGNAVKPAK
jgi:hypothetical protein